MIQNIDVPARVWRANAVSALWMALALWCCPTAAWAVPETVTTDTAPIRVSVSVHPLALLVGAIGGDRVAVSTLLPPGASPHGFEPTPRQIRELAGADLLVTVGGGLDSWATRLGAAVRDGAPHLTLARDDQAGAEHDAHGHGGEDPHLWLDPIRVRDQVLPSLSAALIRVAPDAAGVFSSRAEHLSEQLTDLDRELSERLAPYRGRAFVSFHGAWTHFAGRYNLREVAVVEPSPGREPSARWMRQVIESARREGARAILIEPQFNPRIARTIAEQFGGRVVTVDPLGDPRSPAGASYPALMRASVAAFEEALSE
ncbi:MAG: metal ABC transporter substrate-binding protein [Leptospirillia bacterium]